VDGDHWPGAPGRDGGGAFWGLLGGLGIHMNRGDILIERSSTPIIERLVFMLRIAAVLLAALCSLSAAPQAPVPPAGSRDAWVIPLSEGTNSCESWVDARKNEGITVRGTGIAMASRAWMWGFVSGASAYGRRPLGNVLAPAVDEWVDKYCYNHPLVALDEAGRVLVEELAARAK
jgi:hypothetical protein